MSLKNRLISEGAKLASNPSVHKLLQDERFMRLVVLAMSMPGRVSTFTTDQKERFARELGLVTQEEHAQLRRQLTALEDTVRRMERKHG
jgi:hypothetical protein